MYSGSLWNKKKSSWKNKPENPSKYICFSESQEKAWESLAPQRKEWSNTITILLTCTYIPKMDLLKEIKTNSCDLLATEKTKDKEVKN